MPYAPTTPCSKCGRLFASRRTLRDHEASCLPPGTYTGTIHRVRKVRNRDAYRIHMTLDNGAEVADTVHLEEK